MTPATLTVGGNAAGTFVKTDSSQIIEILGLCALDFVVIDAEHAPFDRATLDRMLLAARAVSLPALVRVPDQRDATILSVLDLGASGIIVPHVDTADQARAVVAAARFRDGRRGISLSARFAGYGTMPRKAAIAAADQSIVIVQIESAEGLAAVETIATIPGIGGLLIGRADLALSLGGDDPDAPDVEAAAHAIVAAAHANALPALLACGGIGDLASLRRFGADAFIIGSDQSLLRTAASTLRPAAAALKKDA